MQKKVRKMINYTLKLKSKSKFAKQNYIFDLSYYYETNVFVGGLFLVIA